MLTKLVWQSFHNIYIYETVTLYTLNTMLHVNYIAIKLIKVIKAGTNMENAYNVMLNIQIAFLSLCKIIYACE